MPKTRIPRAPQSGSSEYLRPRRQRKLLALARTASRVQISPMKSKPSKQTASAPTDCGDVAEWYDQHVGDAGSEYHREVVLPGAVRLLALKPGDRALDVACGQGVLCRLLAGKGVEMTGVDAAPELIRAAKHRQTPESPR